MIEIQSIPVLCAYQLHSSAVLHIVFSFFLFFLQADLFYAFVFLSPNSCLCQETLSSSMSAELLGSDKKNRLLGASNFIHEFIYLSL